MTTMALPMQADAVSRFQNARFGFPGKNEANPGNPHIVRFETMRRLATLRWQSPLWKDQGPKRSGRRTALRYLALARAPFTG